MKLINQFIDQICKGVVITIDQMQKSEPYFFFVMFLFGMAGAALAAFAHH
jgi:F0F1-type ATP synthase assembly protein I